MSKPTVKLGSALSAVIIGATSLIAAAPLAYAADYGCSPRAHNPHASTHEPGRANAVAEVYCTDDPPGY